MDEQGWQSKFEQWKKDDPNVGNILRHLEAADFSNLQGEMAKLLGEAH
jgi:hypothetical protein